MAGLIAAATTTKTTLLGFPILKGGDFLYQDIEQYLKQLQATYPEIDLHKPQNWSLSTEYHFGGYARKNTQLLRFIEDFHEQFSLPIEPVYTGKLFYGVMEKIKAGYFRRGSSVLVLHSGGVYQID